jgi:hypothetical protein
MELDSGIGRLVRGSLLYEGTARELADRCLRCCYRARVSIGPGNGEGLPDIKPEESTTEPREEEANVAQQPEVMIPRRAGRLPVEGPLMRLVATAGVIAIGVVIAAIMTSQHSKGWLIGVVVATVSVVLAGVLWSSRRL